MDYNIYNMDFNMIMRCLCRKLLPQFAHVRNYACINTHHS
jgi:hypothetical protein